MVVDSCIKYVSIVVDSYIKWCQWPLNLTLPIPKTKTQEEEEDAETVKSWGEKVTTASINVLFNDYLTVFWMNR